MSVFRDAVQDCLDYEPTPVVKPGKLNRPKASNDPEVERFSGLRIRYISCFFLTSTRGLLGEEKFQICLDLLLLGSGTSW